MSLLRKRYAIPIVSFLFFSLLSVGSLNASPNKPPERRGDRLYWTPACPIVAQTFNNAADVNGATSDPSSTGWYLNATNVPNAAYFSIKSHRIKAQTLGGVGVWYSQPFNIAGWTNVQIDAKISSEGTFTSSEYMKVGYILDGKETDIETVTGSFGNDSTPTVTSGYLSGSTVQIVVYIYNVTAGNSDYYIEQYDVFKEVGPCTVSTSIPVTASASNSGVLTCTNPSTTLTASTTASGTTTYSWTGPSGFTATGASVTATTAGTYNVTGTNSTGTGTASVVVTSNTAAPGGLTAAASGILTCSVSGVTLTASSTESNAAYTWAGPNSFSATGATATASAAGTYTLTATNPTTGCWGSTSINVTQNETPPANVTAINNGPQTCSNVAVLLTGGSTTSGTTFAWSGPNGFTASGATTNLTSLGQDGTYTLTATNPTNGCTAITTTVVAEDDAAPTGVSVSSGTGSPVLNCTNPVVMLTASSSTPGVTYAWRIGPTGSTVLGTGDTLTVSQPNTYDVLVTNPANGCAFLGGITVSQNVTPPANLLLTSNPTAAVLTCVTSSIAMNANASGSKVGYAWTGPDGFTFNGQTTDVSEPGTYSVTATDSTNGCSATASDIVTQNITPPSLDEQFDSFKGDALSLKVLWSLGAIGVLLLVVACINFINLSTAQSAKRSKEVGVRKVLGSDRWQLWRQFMVETALITLLAVILGALMAEVSLPWLREVMGKPVTADWFHSPTLPLFLLSVGGLVIVLAGFYPAVVLSGFNVTRAIANRISARTVGGLSLRRSLVVVQFAIAQLLIVGTIVVVQQMQFFRTRPMGFDQTAVALLQLPGNVSYIPMQPVLKKSMLDIPGVEAASLTNEGPAGGIFWREQTLFYDHSPVAVGWKAEVQVADPDFVPTMRIPLIAGVLADSGRNEALVNETLLKRLGLHSPQEIIGKKISLNDDSDYLRVTGVVRDYHRESLREAIAPVVIRPEGGGYNYLTLRIRPDRLKTTMAEVQKVFTRYCPDILFDCQWLDERIVHFYEREETTSKLVRVFAGLAILISCIGLYGLVAFLAVQKMKEIGIRKVLGASVGSIVLLFSREFTVLIAAAFLISAPTGYLVMHRWLDGFYYHIELGWGVFAAALFLSLLVAWITVGYKALRAATVNPVNSLKQE